MEILLWVLVVIAAILAGAALWWLLTGDAVRTQGDPGEQLPDTRDGDSKDDAWGA